MFATIRRYQGKKGTLDAAIERVQHEFVPLLTSQPGFVSYTAIHTGNDAVTSVSVFRSREAAEAANTVAAEWVKKNLAEYVGAPETTWGDVVASDLREL
jgi:heme-degrading monooxygenase HmoA